VVIRPHRNDLIDRSVAAAHSGTIRQGLAELPQVPLDAELLADLRNVATGMYSPLRGFISQHDFLKVINDMTLESGVAWTLPIVVDVDVDTAAGVVPSDRVDLISKEETTVGIVDVEDVYRFDAAETAHALFGTTDPAHLGVGLIDRKAPFRIGTRFCSSEITVCSACCSK
jgi:sulfate adenylyltransferase